MAACHFMCPFIFNYTINKLLPIIFKHLLIENTEIIHFFKNTLLKKIFCLIFHRSLITGLYLDNILYLKVFQGVMLLYLIAGLSKVQERWVQLFVIFGASNLTSTFFTIGDNLSTILIEKNPIKFIFKI